MTSSYLDFTIDLNDPRTVAVYDELPLWSAMFGELLLRHLPLRTGLAVLDVGCGTGFPALELAQRLGTSSTVYGIDPWGSALDRARQKARCWGVRNMRFRRGDAASMPFRDETFDLVVSNLGINNFDNPPQVLRECRRVLKRSGRLVLTTNLQGHMREFYSVFKETLREVGPPGASEALRKHIRHRATIPGLRALLAESGFRAGPIYRATATMRFADGERFVSTSLHQAGLSRWLEERRRPDKPQAGFLPTRKKFEPVGAFQGRTPSLDPHGLCRDAASRMNFAFPGQIRRTPTSRSLAPPGSAAPGGNSAIPTKCLHLRDAARRSLTRRRFRWVQDGFTRAEHPPEPLPERPIPPPRDRC